ncbi:MAG: GNAT family N-acetyltransferase, partial [Nitrospirota bacterium]|nr:GNAT family N-acetyltransferase [Nitrospirota bacterium]
MEWDIKTFQELASWQLFDLLQLRVDVFVVEQECAYRELDEYDRHPETR